MSERFTPDWRERTRAAVATAVALCVITPPVLHEAGIDTHGIPMVRQVDGLEDQFLNRVG